MEKKIALDKYKTKSELAAELGISLSTLQRRLNKAKLTVPRGLLPPLVQAQIVDLLNNATDHGADMK